MYSLDLMRGDTLYDRMAGHMGELATKLRQRSRLFASRPALVDCCVMVVVVAGLVYGLQGLLGSIAFFDEGWAVWWPANGIELAILLTVGRRHWLWILIAFTGGVALSARHDPLGETATVAACNLIEVLLPAFLLPRFRTMDRWLSRPGISTRFVVTAMVAGPALSSLLGGLYFHYGLGQPFVADAVRWGAADLLGIALFTPLLLALISRDTWALFARGSLAHTAGLLR